MPTLVAIARPRYRHALPQRSIRLANVTRYAPVLTSMLAPGTEHMTTMTGAACFRRHLDRVHGRYAVTGRPRRGMYSTDLEPRPPRRGLSLTGFPLYDEGCAAGVRPSASSRPVSSTSAHCDNARRASAMLVTDEPNWNPPVCRPRTVSTARASN